MLILVTSQSVLLKRPTMDQTKLTKPETRRTRSFTMHFYLTTVVNLVAIEDLQTSVTYPSDEQHWTVCSAESKADFNLKKTTVVESRMCGAFQIAGERWKSCWHNTDQGEIWFTVRPSLSRISITGRSTFEVETLVTIGVELISRWTPQSLRYDKGICFTFQMSNLSA